MPRHPLLPLLALLLALAVPARAQISMPDGVALSPFPVAQNPAAYVTFGDGVGGLWAVFQGATPGSGLFVRHVDADGTPGLGFTQDPKRIADDGTLVNNISAAPDGIGGAVITWFGTNPKDSTSQFIALRFTRVTYEGTLATRDTGVVVSSVASSGQVVGDGTGGAYVAWEEVDSISNPDIVVQRYSPLGAALWTPFSSPTGVTLCAAVGLQRLRSIIADGANGAYVVWADSRTSNTVPLYAGRLTPSGVAGAPWPTNGVRVSPVSSGIRFSGIARSSTNGLLLAWRDLVLPTQIIAQHVLPTGAMGWPAGGTMVTTAGASRVEFVPAPAGGAFVTWGGTDIRSQRISASGTRLWSELPGRVLITPVGGAVNVRAACDDAGGQRLLWSWDNAGQTDMSMLRVDSTGVLRPGESAFGTVLESDAVAEDAVGWHSPESASPVIVWLEAGVLRARRLDANPLDVPPGTTGPLALAAPNPNPVRGGSFTLRFAAPAGAARIELFDVTGRRVLERAFESTGGAQAVRLEPGSRMAPGVYTARLSAGGTRVTRRIVRAD